MRTPATGVEAEKHYAKGVPVLDQLLATQAGLRVGFAAQTYGTINLLTIYHHTIKIGLRSETKMWKHGYLVIESTLVYLRPSKNRWRHARFPPSPLHAMYRGITSHSTLSNISPLPTS